MTATMDDERGSELYDYAADMADGFTNLDAMDHFDWDLPTFNTAVRALRLMLAEDEITLTAEPNGLGPWTYKLVGTYEDARTWAVNRLKDTEARLETQEAVSAALVNATDGRTVDGRKARLIHETLSHLRQMIRLMSDGDEGTLDL